MVNLVILLYMLSIVCVTMVFEFAQPVVLYIVT